jgi:glycine/D-amino acid oxidase-like deaminating enzyme/nitrite reductase/ring-hydroxylating ferredoxin subunit
MKHASIWIDTTDPQPALPELDGALDTDVAIVGGGIVGITLATLLAESGVRVMLLEGNQLARGVSGHTTAKVSSQHGMIYARIASNFGAEAARLYGAANESALAWMGERAQDIDCDWRAQTSYAYVPEGEDRSHAEVEAEAAAQAGLPARLVDSTPLPYGVEAAVRFDRQAEFHPRKYLLGLADGLAGDGAEVFENSRVTTIDTDEDLLVKTPGGRVRANTVVLATHYPFMDRTLSFARVHPQRSYAIVCRTAEEPPPGMFISSGSTTRSVRAVPVGGEDLLLVGGEGHKTGTGGDTEARYAALEEFARRHWTVESVEYRWSSQDNTTIDQLPYVGPATPRTDRLLMATGFAKWGMTGGTVAAMILADRILGRPNPWAELYDPNRFNLKASATRLVEENAQAGVRFLGDRLTKRGTRPIEDLVPGEGDIVSLNGEKVAGFRDDDGTLTAVSPICTHLACQVNWNTAERSWDCPCHGSRYAPDGEVLQGPAVHRLELKPIDD